MTGRVRSESNPGPTHYECPGHRPTSAHPVHVGTPVPPRRHSVHTWRYRCLSFRPRVRQRRRSLTRSWTPSQSRSEPTRGLEPRTVRLHVHRVYGLSDAGKTDHVSVTVGTRCRSMTGVHGTEPWTALWRGCAKARSRCRPAPSKPPPAPGEHSMLVSHGGAPYPFGARNSPMKDGPSLETGHSGTARTSRGHARHCSCGSAGPAASQRSAHPTIWPCPMSTVFRRQPNRLHRLVGSSPAFVIRSLLAPAAATLTDLFARSRSLCADRLKAHRCDKFIKFRTVTRKIACIQDVDDVAVFI
jgi:hypothetical protein